MHIKKYVAPAWYHKRPAMLQRPLLQIHDTTGIPDSSQKIPEPGLPPGPTKKNERVPSTLCFTGKCIGSPIIAGVLFALLYTGLAGRELRIGNQRAAPAARITPGILPAFISKPVLHRTDLRGIRSARELKTVAGG
jgi:hypothetical protein